MDLNVTTGLTTVFVQEGKGVRANRAMYHIPTHCPPEWRQELQHFLRLPREAHSRLFRPSVQDSDEALRLLRTANANLDCRSVRRGALQTMAASGASEDDMMVLSGHRSKLTLRRYLDWDRINAARHQQAQNAARALSAEQQLQQDPLLQHPPHQQ